MKNGLITAVVLAGGSGTRLWPISRLQLPKQFLTLLDGKSLFSATLERLDPIVSRNNVVVVTSQQAASSFPSDHWEGCQLLVEPAGRNTAPAIAVAAQFLLETGDCTMVVLPSDHAIADCNGFQDCLSIAIRGAQLGNLMTFAIRPTRAETGFGYLQLPERAKESAPVLRFKEKPSAEVAEEMLSTGDWFWNSGMFVWRASTILDALKAYAPEVYEVSEQIRSDAKTAGWKAAIDRHFHSFPNISIDHAVMERAGNVHAVPADIGWSDVGSWDAVHQLAPKDAQGNALEGDVIAIDSDNCLVRASHRTIASIGISDITIIDTPDALLVAKRGQAQEIRRVVQTLEQRNSHLHVEHTTTIRPWGNYTVLKESPGYKLKSIVVKPGGKLSLQRHKHRSEHWVVMSGIATVTRDTETFEVVRNESTYIPIGAIHRLENRGTEPLEIIEVQVGSYVGEDDIERLEDQYGRSLASTAT